MFIEAMTLYSEYYGLLDETNVFLTEVDDDVFIPKEIEVNENWIPFGVIDNED